MHARGRRPEPMRGERAVHGRCPGGLRPHRRRRIDRARRVLRTSRCGPGRRSRLGCALAKPSPSSRSAVARNGALRCPPLPPTSTTTRTTSTSTPIRTRSGSDCATSSRCTTTTSTTSMRSHAGTDVEAGLKDHGRLISSHGTILELIKANIEMPPGMVIFDDPPSHTAYRGLMSRVFTPRKMNAIEPEVQSLLPGRARRDRRCDRVRHRRGAGGEDADAGDRHVARHPRIRPAGDPRPDRQRAPSRLGRGLQRRRSRTSAERRPRAASATTSTGGWNIPSDDVMTQLVHDRVRGPHRRHAHGSPARRCSATSICSPAPATRPPPS